MGQIIKIKRDTAANWAAANPVLADGVQGRDKTNKKTKTGDGVTAWNSLPFDKTDYADITNAPAIPAAQVQPDWNAASGLGMIQNKPAIPAAQVQPDWNAASGLGAIQNKPVIYGDPSSATLDGGSATG